MKTNQIPKITRGNNIAEKKSSPYKVKTAELETTVKDVDAGKRIVTGIYNTALFFDSDYDVMMKGAANRSIAASGPNGPAVAKIKHLLFHDWTKLPGKIITLQEKMVNLNGQNITGIYFETKMADTEKGNDTLINYQDGIYDNHSIGFTFLDGQYIQNDAEDWSKIVSTLINPEAAEEVGYMYLWKEYELYEGSTVAFGANELTPYLGSKTKNKETTIAKLNDRIDRLSKAIKSGTQTDETLHCFEMQMLQIKQMVKELLNQPSPPLLKDTLRHEAHQDKGTSGDYMTCSNCSLEFATTDAQGDGNGNYYCPDCQTLCMAKAANTGKFDLKTITNHIFKIEK
jgi:phage head maturation protease